MSRLAPLLVAILAGSLFAVGCRSRFVPRDASPRAEAPARAVVPRDAVVRPVGRPSGSTVALVEVDGRRRAIVADEEESAIQVVDLETRAIVSTRKLAGAPGQILVSPSGVLFAAIRGAASVVAIRLHADGTSRELVHQETGDEPFGLALTPDGATLLVSTIVEARLEAYRVADLTPVFATALRRDPRSIAVTSDGARAFVTHATGSVVSVVEVGGASPGTARAIALDARERRRDFGLSHISKPMPMPFASTKSMAIAPPEVRITMKRSASQGFGLAMIGERAFLPETLVMTSDTERIPTGYGSVEQSTLGSHVPFVARVVAVDEKLENAELSGPADKECFERRVECIVPHAVADDGAKLYVACLDSDEVMVVDPAEDAEHAPSCRKALKERTRVRVESPSGLAIDPARGELVVFSSFTRKLTIAALAGGAPAEVVFPRSAALPELVAEGRRLFHQSADARIAKNGRACASCHVDGRDDGLVWPTPKGKRQTPMLAGRVDGTAPYGWNGEHDSLVVHIKATIQNLEGTGVSPSQLEALAQYVASMHVPPKRSATTDAITRGKSIFHSSEAGCSSCHVEDMRFTDRETHAFGANTRTQFDTPSLAFVGQTAPYFHDGRFQTLEALVDACEDPTTMMGRTKHLVPDDRRALVSYLRSL